MGRPRPDKKYYTIRFLTEEDRSRGLYELYNSDMRSACVWNHKYVVFKEHLDLFDEEKIKYKVLR